MPESLIELTVERPAAGGRMIARHGGDVVLVAGAVPGERVRARVERRKKRVIWAAVTDVLEPSADRRVIDFDPACGGMAYAHIQYARQLELKREVVVDAFRHVGRMTLSGIGAVAPSPERGYRLRARLRLAAGRAMFLREGSHALCDPGPTGQLMPAALEAVQDAAAALSPYAAACEALVVAENVRATERVLHVETREGAGLEAPAVGLALPHGITGMTTWVRGHLVTLAGLGTVSDTAADLFGAASPVGDTPRWTRHGASFFQGNRFLTGELVRRVLAAAGDGERIVDLYAGVGLFAVALAARGARVLAVEGDRSSAGDLAANAGPWRERLRPTRSAVEDILSEPLDPAPDVVVLDPPRTGLSARALEGLLAWRAPRVVYVSCDAATLARDASRLVAGGYALAAIDAFDLFPNTPHVETVAVFERLAAG